MVSVHCAVPLLATTHASFDLVSLFILSQRQQLHYLSETMMCQLLEQIENDNITSLTLEATPKETLEKKKPEALIEALGKNTSLVSVTMQTDFLACLRGDIRSQVVQAIGKLPSLQSVSLGNSLLLAPDLITLVKTAKSLTTLTLTDICLQGEPTFIEDLQRTIASHASLKDFTLSNCMASNQSVNLSALETIKAGNGCGKVAAIDPAADVNAATAA
jgi:hypothetical protein